MKHSVKYLLLLLGCLLWHFTPFTAEGGQEYVSCKTSEYHDVSKRKSEAELLTAPHSDTLLAAENNPFGSFFRIVHHTRLLVRVPARLTQFHFSFGKNTLLHSLLKDSLIRVSIRIYSLNHHHPSLLPCNYYVFALRKILI
jgi:hypothetical protein